MKIGLMDPKAIEQEGLADAALGVGCMLIILVTMWALFSWLIGGYVWSD